MSKRDEQIARMRGLMTYGISNADKKTPITESIEGPDGKIYAIIREGNKFYIKSANKGSKLVSESFDYIGGFMNKKNNEYSSYNQASKNLELKVRSLNETYGINKPVELLNPDKKETLMVEMTDSMKNSIARYRQIMNNAANIMNESSTISMNNTGNPEAPKTTSFSPKIGEPFNNTATAILDKDLKQTANNPEKQGEPFGDTEKTEDYKDAQYVPKGSVANQKPSGGKVVRVNENSDFEETIEECDEWGSCGLPSKEGVGEIGDNDPFTKSVNENNYFHNPNVADDEQLSDLPDEITLDEDADSFVGFADEDNEMDESEESEDLDLDDIDLDLDSDDEKFEDDDIDDIDSEDEGFEDDDIDSEDEGFEDDEEIEFEDEEDEIESLRTEVEELRNMVNSLLNKDEEDIELEVDDEDFEDDEEFENDEDFEDDEEFEDDEDFEDEEEYISDSIISRKLNETAVPFKGNLPDTYNVHYNNMYNPKTYYAQAINFLKEHQDENDTQTIQQIKSNLSTIYECEQEISYYIENKHINKEDWEVVINCMVNNMAQIIKNRFKLSFFNDADLAEEFDDILDGIDYKISKFDTIYKKIKNNEDLKDIDNKFFDVRPNLNQIPTLDDDIEEEYEDENKKISNIKDSINPRKIYESNRLNDFGKHPGYRKKVMSLPKTGSDNENGYYDWNDDSVYSEEPFGSKIGKSSPFDNAVERAITSVLESFKKKI